MNGADSVHFSTGKDDWATPDALFDVLDAEFGFTCDAAANVTNHKTPFWIGPGAVDEDALALETWGHREVVWLNPPYSRPLQGRFIAKAAEQAWRFGHTVVMLLPARTDTAVFHTWIWDTENHCPREGVEVRLLKGRVRFKGAPASAPFPSMVVVFRGAAIK